MPPRSPPVNAQSGLKPGRVVLGLIVANAGLQLLFGLVGSGTLLDRLYFDWLALSVGALSHGALWSLVTYGFLHDLQDISHLLFNMVALYFLGRPLEQRWGERGFLRFWLGCLVGGGIAGALFHLVTDASAHTVGASAGVMGLVGAWSWLFPNQRLLLFFVIPVPARRIVWLAVAIDFVVFATGGNIAIAAHLGGLGAAWLILNGWTRPRLLRTRLHKWRIERAIRAKKRARSGLHVIDGGKNRPRKGGPNDDDDDDDDDPRYNIH